MNVASSDAVIQMMIFGPEGTTNELFFFIRELFILILWVIVVFFLHVCMGTTCVPAIQGSQ